MAKISVIVPVYKVEKYLARCVNSLICQTLSDLEIILVDDGSPDNCPKLCDEWAEKDSRIKVIHKENGGLGFARNSGLDIADGEFVGFMDSDDYAEPDMYETLYNSAKENDADLAMTGFKCIGGIMVSQEDSVEVINDFRELTVFRGKEGIDDLLLNISGSRPEDNQDSKYGFSSVKNIYKNSVIKENGIRFENERKVMSEDVLFVLSFINSINCAVGVPGAGYCYCRNGESLSKSYRGDRFERCRELISVINTFLDKRMPKEKYQIYTDRLFQAYARAASMQEIQFAKQNNLTRKELNERLLGICGSEDIQNVLKRYPWKKLPKTQMIFAFTMRYKKIGLMKLLMKLKERT